jgi:hypothetical protein
MGITWRVVGLTYPESFSINILKKIARGADLAESPWPFKAGRPYEPVWIIPAKGSGRRKSRNASIGITVFLFVLPFPITSES